MDKFNVKITLDGTVSESETQAVSDLGSLGEGLFLNPNFVLKAKEEKLKMEI